MCQVHWTDARQAHTEPVASTSAALAFPGSSASVSVSVSCSVGNHCLCCSCPPAPAALSPAQLVVAAFVLHPVLTAASVVALPMAAVPTGLSAQPSAIATAGVA